MHVRRTRRIRPRRDGDALVVRPPLFVLATIGSGESTFARIGNRTGIDQGGLARSHTLLEARYWTRDNAVEVDLVVADRATAPATPTAVGSVTWRDCGPFDARDLADLHAARAQVPGAGSAATVAVGRAGVDVRDVDLALTPGDLLSAWA